MYDSIDYRYLADLIKQAFKEALREDREDVERKERHLRLEENRRQEAFLQK